MSAGVALADYLKDRSRPDGGRMPLWVQKNPDPRLCDRLTAFNPYAGKDDPSQFSAMNAAMAVCSQRSRPAIRRSMSAPLPGATVQPTLLTTASASASAPMPYTTITMRSTSCSNRLVAAVNATSLPQLSD